MKHNHNHACQCEHQSVKYCSHCHTVYCESCNQEWTAKSSWTYFPYYQPSTITYGSTLKDLSIPMGQGQNTNTLDDARITICKHGAY